MMLWKCVICLTFLLVAAAESDQDVSSSISLPVNLTSFFATRGDGLKQMLLKYVSSPKSEQVAVVNDYTDDLMSELNQWLILEGFDPIEMPDLVNEFEWKALFITYKGEMSLKNGWLQGLGTMKRTADVTVWYEYPNVKIHMPLGYDVFVFDYSYKAKFMGMGPKGMMDGRSTNCRFTIDIHVNMISLLARLERFKLHNIGYITLKFSGNILVDWMANIFVIVTIPFIKPILNYFVEDFIAGGLLLVIDTYNSIVCAILTCI